MTFWLVVAFVFGLNIGSFLNVVIWRLPRGGSLSDPQWSYCPRCEHRLGALDLIPVLSFLALGRKCRYCKARISWRYPAIETLTALLFVAVVWHDRATIDSIFDCVFTAALVCVFFIDLEHFVIPDGLNAFAGVVGIAHNLTNIGLHKTGQTVRIYGVPVPVSIIGGLGYAFVIYTIGLLGAMWFARGRVNPFVAAWQYIVENVMDWVWIALWYLGAVIRPLRRFVPESEPLEGVTAEEIEQDEEAGAMGGGDGKLAAGIGANIGLGPAIGSFFFACLFGALAGMILMAVQRRRLSGRTAIPFGPAMAAAALFIMLCGNVVARAYGAYLSSVAGPAAPPATTVVVPVPAPATAPAPAARPAGVPPPSNGGSVNARPVPATTSLRTPGGRNKTWDGIVPYSLEKYACLPYLAGSAVVISDDAR